MNDPSAVSVLENRFQSKCDGTWEHRFGLTIQTTAASDRHMTIMRPFRQKTIADAIAALPKDHRVQVESTETSTNLRVPRVRDVISSAAVLQRQSERSGKNTHGAPEPEASLQDADCDEAIRSLDRWFTRHGRESRERRSDITVETTDNPGWLLTFGELRLAKERLVGIIADLLHRYDAEVGTEGTTVRIFARTLPGVLRGAAAIVE